MKLQFSNWSTTFAKLGFKRTGHSSGFRDTNSQLALESLEDRMMLSASLGSSLPFVNQLPGTGSASGQFVAEVYGGGSLNVVEVDVIDDQQPPFFGYGSSSVYVSGNLTYGTHTVKAHAVDYMSWMMGGAFGEWQTYSVTISSPMPSAPIDSNSAPNSVAEGAANGTQVGITAFSTIPNGGMVTYSLSNNAGGRFGIDANSGVVTVANSSLLNFESAAAHTITVQANAGSGSAMSQSFTIGVSNVNPTTPIDSNQTANSVPEGSIAHTPVGIIATSVDPNGPSVTYTLSNDANSRFEINSTTGVVSVSNGALLDFESAASHTITVLANDGAGGSSAQNFTISVTNVNEAPEITSDGGGVSASISVAEEQTAVTDVESTDLDGETEASGDLTYAITGGADQGKFSIVANTGVLTFKTAPDFDIRADSDKDNIYHVQVTVTDPGGLTDVQDIAVTLTNVNEAPVLTNITEDPAPLTIVTLPLSGKAGAIVFDADAIDPDNPAAPTPAVQTLTFTLDVYFDDGLFTINSKTGEITLTKDIPLATANATYYLTVRVTDSGSPALSDTGTVTVNLVTAVGILGDTEAIEGGADNIKLKVRRYTFDNSVPLTVYYKLDWTGIAPTDSHYDPVVTGNASVNDIDSTDLGVFLNDPSGNFGSVTILAGEIVADLRVLRAVSDNFDANGDVGKIENFVVQIIPDPSNAASYEEIKDVPPDDKKKSYMDARNQQELIIVDHVQLFSPDNVDATLDDNALIGTGNPGIHFNDVRQGQIGDCWFLTAVIQLARIDYSKLQRLFHDNGDGTYKVALYESTGWVWKQYNADELLTRGRNGVKLSGDGDLGGMEIWPNLLERRVADYDHSFNGGRVSDAWKMLTGEEPTYHSTNGMDAFTIYNKIQAAYAKFDGVIVSTKDSFANRTTQMTVNSEQKDNVIYADHAYLVEDVPFGGITLLNPWGTKHVKPMLYGYSDDVLDGWYEFTDPILPGPSPPGASDEQPFEIPIMF